MKILRKIKRSVGRNFEFAKQWGLICEVGHNMDGQIMLTFGFIWGIFYITLPFLPPMVKHYEPYRCESSWEYRWGFSWAYDIESLYILMGWKTFVFWLPFFTWKIYDRQILNKDEEWISEPKLSWGELSKWEKENHGVYVINDFTWTDGSKTTSCTAKIKIHRTLKHRKWFPFLKERQDVWDIRFSEEMGAGTGSYKGGTIAISHWVDKWDDFKTNKQTILKALDR